jgi:hypothetical protein
MSWRGVLAIVFGLAVAAGPAAAQTTREARSVQSVQPPSPAVQAVMEITIGVQPHAEMHWPQVLEQVGMRAVAGRLRQVLVGLWLREAAGEPLPAPMTIAEAVERSRPPPDTAADVARWASAFAQRLAPRLPAAAAPLPDEIENLRAQLVDAGPGLWLHLDARGSPRGLFAWIELVNRSDRAFPAAAFQLRAAPEPRGQPALLRCLPPRGTPPRVLAPGAAAGFLCRLEALTPLGAAPQPATWFGAAQLRGLWQITPEPLASDSQRAEVADALAAPLQTAREAWMRANASRCEQLGNCAQAQRAERAAERTEARRTDRSRRQLWNVLQTWGTVLGVVGAYVLLARLIGPWPAAAIGWVAGMVVCVPFGLAVLRSNTADSWGGFAIIPIGLGVLLLPTVAAVALPNAYNFVVRWLRDPQYRVRVIWGLVAAAAGVLVMLLFAILRRVLFY